MRGVRPELADKYASLIRFLASDPSFASNMRGRTPPTIGSEAYITGQAQGFAVGREPKSPERPSTVPDEIVSLILHEYFEVPKTSLEQAKTEHQLSMAAENIVGDLLERFLASVLEEHGWIWCSGSMVKAVDFIKPPARTGGAWRLLQVKNRDNSENSSSSAIRDGTDIEKWFRTFSRRAATNWGAFPDPSMHPFLDEAKFKAFVKAYLTALKAL